MTAEYSLRQDELVSFFHQFESILDETRTRIRTVEFAKEVRPGGYSRDVWVELCGRGIQTLTLFTTKIVNFATLLKTKNSFYEPR